MSGNFHSGYLESYALTCGQKDDLKANSVVPESTEEEESIDEDRPDCNIRREPGGQSITMITRSSIPEDSNECPD